MHHATTASLGRLATAISGMVIIGIVACSDGASTAPSVSPLGTSIAADRGGHGGGSDQQRDQHDNSGPGNNDRREHDDNQNDQNNNQNNHNQNQDRVRFDIRLMRPAADTMFRGAEGRARFEMRSDRTELEIEVEHIPTGTAVVFLVNGTQVGTGVASVGEAELELSTRKGDTIPAVAAGTTVTVQTADGTVIVSGTF